MFKSEFLTEWERLNPPSAQPGAGLGAAFQDAWRAYFAPLWLACWLVKRAARGAP